MGVTKGLDLGGSKSDSSSCKVKHLMYPMAVHALPTASWRVTVGEEVPAGQYLAKVPTCRAAERTSCSRLHLLRGTYFVHLHKLPYLNLPISLA